MNSFIRKYKFVLLPLILVVFFDTALLVVNSYTAEKIEAVANSINIAGRQRMLSQKITKSLSLIHYHKHHSNAVNPALNKELATASHLFNQTLRAFIYGGEATSAAGKTIQISSLTNADAIKALHSAESIWLPLYEKLNVFLLLKSTTDTEMINMVQLFEKNGELLLTLMNDLTIALETESEKMTISMRQVQLIAVIMILLSFTLAAYRLYRRENYYNDLMEKSSDVVISVNTQTALTTFVSSSVFEMLGYNDKHYIARPANLFFTKESKSSFDEILETVHETGKLTADRCEAYLLKKGGSVLAVDMLMKVTTSEDGHTQELSVDIRDISERKEMEVALAELAHKDSLTGLANRTLFYSQAEHAINIAKRHKTKIAIMFIDLDGFKLVNDNYGHDMGDAVLIETADRITKCLRETDSVARVGGDEFIVLLEDVTNNEGISKLANKVLKSISEAIIISDYSCNIGASIGIAVYPNNAQDLGALIKKADIAMYKVKNTGKNRMLFADK